MGSLKRKILKYYYKAKKKLASFILLVYNKLFKKLAVEDSFEQTKLDKKLIYSLSKSKIPSPRQFKYIKKFLSAKELKIIKICLLVILVTVFFWSWRFYQTYLQIVPKMGGKYIEGLIGVPKYINPLYASAGDVDSDISQLVFSSIFKRGKDGELVNDLATDYKISEDNKLYTFKIRTDIKWHNDEDLTVDDIIFTFEAIKDINYKSPLRASFVGVEIEKIDEETIAFVLAEPYAAFLELLTFGIIPKHLWLQILPESANLAELNLKPIGSGVYKFKSLVKDKAGNIKIYNLTINDKYYKDKPYIEDLSFKFFINFEEAISALNENNIDGLSYLPRYFKDEIISQDSLSFYELNLPQITAIFFNQKNNPLLGDIKVRQALALAIDKTQILNDIFEQNVHLIDGPILPDNFSYNKDIKKYKFNLEEAAKLLKAAQLEPVEISQEDITEAESNLKSDDENIKKEAEAKLMLGAGNWLKKKSADKNEYFIIDLTTVETDDNIKVVEFIKESWEKLGIKINLNIVPVNQMQAEVIRPRDFTALFYGQVVGNDPDAYAFWHSSQISEAGLNITSYINKEVDKLLEDARLTNDREIRTTKYKKFQEILAEEVPAIFMYSPTYTYVQSKKVKGFDIKNILIPRDRLSNINEWYIETKKKIVW